MKPFPPCAILDDQRAKKMLICRISLRMLWVPNPLLKPNLPQTSPYGPLPQGSCIASATNQNTDIICEFSLIFSFSHAVILFWLNFGHFWPPTVSDLNLKVYYLCVESARKTDFYYWCRLFLFIFYLSLSFLGIFSLCGPYGGVMGPCYGLLCPTGIHMELGPQVCHFRWLVCQKNAQLW